MRDGRLQVPGIFHLCCLMEPVAPTNSHLGILANAVTESKVEDRF